MQEKINREELAKALTEVYRACEEVWGEWDDFEYTCNDVCLLNDEVGEIVKVVNEYTTLTREMAVEGLLTDRYIKSRAHLLVRMFEEIMTWEPGMTVTERCQKSFDYVIELSDVRPKAVVEIELTEEEESEAFYSACGEYLCHDDEVSYEDQVDLLKKAKEANEYRIPRDVSIWEPLEGESPERIYTSIMTSFFLEKEKMLKQKREKLELEAKVVSSVQELRSRKDLMVFTIDFDDLKELRPELSDQECAEFIQKNKASLEPIVRQYIYEIVDTALAG